MERTQISLEPEQAERLRRLARDRGVSMAHLIRDAVDRTYGTAVTESMDAKWDRAVASVHERRPGSRLSDVAAEHDKYLDETYGDR